MASEQTLWEMSIDMLATASLDGYLTRVNPSWEAVLGYTPAELTARPYLDFVHPDDVARTLEEAQALLAPGHATVSFENRYRAKDGGYRWLAWNARAGAGGATVYCVVRDVTAVREAAVEREQLLNELSQRDLMLTGVVENSMTLIYVKDLEGRYLLYNESFADAFGLQQRGAAEGKGAMEVLLGRDDRWLDPELEPVWRANDLRAARESVSIEEWSDHPELGRLTFDSIKFPLYDVEGNVYATCGVSLETTERVRAIERHKEAEERFKGAFEHAPIGMALVDLTGAWLQVNRVLCTMLRYSEAELLALTRQDMTHPDDLAADLEQVERLISGEIDHAELEKRFIDSRGEAVWASLSRSVVRNSAGRPLHVISQIRDISERRQFEAKLSHLADHDGLTGLFNRRRFEQELERQVAYTERYGTPATLLMLDLDNFKYVNDTLGHAMGDELLVRVASALRERMRTTDIVARLGGDEFAVILPETDPAAGQAVAAAVLATIRNDCVVLREHHAIQVSASIGVAPIQPGVSLTPAELMMNADVSMYDAKDAGRGRFAVYDPEADSAARLTDTVTWAERIRTALANDGFVLYQQPILDLHTGVIARHELLLRMLGPDGEHIAPATFLYVAERFGLIQEIDAWVVRQAIALVASQEKLGRRLQLEVNLSGLSLTSPEVIETIERELERTAIDPSCLTFEITETAAIVNIQKARGFAERISQLGCGFALDDFGAGFGSFYYLKHLPFDVLKIDGEFVRNLRDSVKDQLVVKSLARIASELGKNTVAEFVEDDETRDLVRSYGVDYAQGYGIGRPQPVDEWLSLDASPAAAAALTTS